MIVCHCRAVSERTIRAAIREGAHCRRSIGRACAAGRSCGGCTLAIDEILRSELEKDAAPALNALPDLATAG